VDTIDSCTFDVTERNGIPIMTLHGKFDIYASASVFGALKEQIIRSEVTHLIIDISDLTQIDSTGLGVLYATHKLLRTKGGSLVLVIPENGKNQHIRRSMEITGISRLFAPTETKEEAIEAIDRLVAVTTT